MPYVDKLKRPMSLEKRFMQYVKIGEPPFPTTGV